MLVTASPGGVEQVFVSQGDELRELRVTFTNTGPRERLVSR
jgi:hypothetical protein